MLTNDLMSKTVMSSQFKIQGSFSSSQVRRNDKKPQSKIKNQDLERTLNLNNPEHYLVLPEVVLVPVEVLTDLLEVSPLVEGALAPQKP